MRSETRRASVAAGLLAVAGSTWLLRDVTDVGTREAVPAPTLARAVNDTPEEQAPLMERLPGVPASTFPVEEPEERGEPEPAPRVIEGWVTTSSGTYLAGAQVGASSEDGAVFTSTDEDGRFRLEALPSETMNVFATASGRAADHAYNISAGTRELLLIVDDPAELTGTFSVGSLPHLFVRLCHHSEQVDREICIKSKYSSPPSGAFEMDGLPSGPFDVVFSSDEKEIHRLRVDLKPGEKVTVPHIQL